MLEVLGLDRLAESLYLTLVDNPPLSGGELARRTGTEPELVGKRK
ncbi:hypothetical protein ACEZCY_04700 [Streptacidiphilus sp. N1-12]|uniref:Uncharacterized protein n=2 Tax=Streptacidiphilus alkalitolerans TaxID=3342712 RepID=A0ABV6W8Z2_9ACTN